MKGSKKPGVMLYFELYPMLKQMTAEDAHALIMAIFEYAQNGVLPQFSSQALMYVWEFVRLNIAVPTSWIEEMLHRLQNAYNKLNRKDCE